MGAGCCKPAEPEKNPDGTLKEVPTPEQQAGDPVQLRQAIKSSDAGGAEMLLRRMPRAAINSGATKKEAPEDQLGYTALHYAAQANWLTGCRLLVLYGASQRVPAKAGRKTPLHLAVEGGKRKVAAFLLELEEPTPEPSLDGKPRAAPKAWRSASMDAKDSSGQTPLLVAFLTGRLHFTTWFVSACMVYERACDYDVVDEGGEHAALCCARFGWWDLLKSRVVPGLKDGKKVLNVRSKEGETVLGWLFKYLLTGATSEAEFEVVLRLLHGAGADVQVPALKERIPLMCLSAATGNCKLVDKLISLVPPPPEGQAPPPGPPAIVMAKDALGHSALHYAAAAGDKDMCQLLISKGLSVQAVDKSKATPSHLSAMRGHGELALQLLSDLSEAGRKQALAAVDALGHHLGHLSLLGARCDADAQKSALDVLKMMDEQAAALPVQDKFKIGGKQDTPLMLAITGHMDLVVEDMLAKGASPNETNKKQQLPLARNLESVTQATAARDARIFNLLIKSGTQVDTVNPAEHPLLAVCRSSVDTFSAMAVQTLEDLSMGKLDVKPAPAPEPKSSQKGKGNEVVPLLPRTPGPLDWNLVDEKGHNPMIIAAQSGSCYIVKYLANKFPDLINKQAETDGTTPLMQAAAYAQCATLRVLLDLGADVMVVDKDGHDAMWHGLTLDMPETLECASLLLYKGAPIKQVTGGGPDGKQPSEYTDIIGEGWLHRAVRYGAVEFIRLWASMGGALHVQCTTPDVANDMRTSNKVVVEEESDFMDMQVDPPEDDEWDIEEVEAASTPHEPLRIDPNQQQAVLLKKLPSAGQAKSSLKSKEAEAACKPNSSTSSPIKAFKGPVAESFLPDGDAWREDDPAHAASSYMDLCPAGSLKGFQCMGHKWFDTLNQDLVTPDEDDPICEETQQLISDLEKQHAQSISDPDNMGALNMYDIQFHVHDQVITLPAGMPLGEGTCLDTDMECDQLIANKIDADMAYARLLLDGQDPLSPHMLAARKATKMLDGSQTGLAGPVAEAWGLNMLSKEGEEGQEGKKDDAKSGLNKEELKWKARAALRAAKSLVFKKVDNRDPYYEQMYPDDEDKYAVRKYKDTPQYVKQAIDMCKPLTAAETMQKAEELHARLKQYTDKDKNPDKGLMLVGPSLCARNIQWWNHSLSPDEYPLSLGQWRRLDKKMAQAQSAARKRAPVSDPKKIKPRKRTAIFGLPDMPSRPELLDTGALTYAVRLCRPDVLEVLLQLSPGCINQIDGWGYTALSYALRLLARDKSDRSVACMVDMLLLALPEANLVTRFKPVREPAQRKEIIKFVERNMAKLKDCWVDTQEVEKSGCGGTRMKPDEGEIIARLLRKLTPPPKGAYEAAGVGKWRKQAHEVLGLCRASVMEPLIACVAMSDVSRLAWLVRKCGGNMEAAFVYLPEIPAYFKGLLERDVDNLMSMCNPLHMAVAMKSFDLTRWVVDLGADINAVGSPRYDTPHNPWTYGIAFTKALNSLKDDVKDEINSRKSAAECRKEVEKKLLLPMAEAKKRFTPSSCLTDGSIPNQYEKKGGLFSSSKDEEKKVKKILAGSIFDKIKRLKRLIMSIEIPGITRPHTWISPLHVAARTGQAQVAYLLLQRGASPDGGPVRPYAKRTPLQEAIMYARANFMEYNWDAGRKNFEEVADCIDASLPGMNMKLQLEAAKEVFKAMKDMYNMIMMDAETHAKMMLKAFANTVKFLVVKVLEMRRRAIVHWDPALATAHVLLLARAPLDPSETQSNIMLRDIIDNGSWAWLGKEMVDAVKTEEWMYQAKLYVFRLRESKLLGWGSMDETGDLQWYRWAKKKFTERCDAAFYAAGAKVVVDAYNNLSEAALKKCAQTAIDRRVKIQEQHKADVEAMTKARHELFTASCNTLVTSRKETAAKFKEAIQLSADSYVLEVQAPGTAGSPDNAQRAGATAGGWVVEETGTKSINLTTTKSKARPNSQPAFCAPSCLPWKSSSSSTLSKAAGTKASEAAVRLHARLSKGIKQTANDLALTALVCNADPTVPPTTPLKLAAVLDSDTPDTTDLIKAADTVSGLLGNLGLSLGGFDVEVKVKIDEVVLDGISAHIDGAVAAAGELHAGLQDVLEVLNIEASEENDSS